MRLFRGKFCAELKKHLSKDLRLPDAASAITIKNLINQLGRKDWHVEIMQQYKHGKGVINYLARYVRGGPISNNQLTEANDKIQLSYHSHQTHRNEQHTFSKAGFIKQLLIHVPDKGKRTVRFYGLYTSGKRDALNKARTAHKQPPVSKTQDILDWQSYLRQLGKADLLLCPICQKSLIVKERFRKGRDPTGIKPERVPTSITGQTHAA